MDFFGRFRRRKAKKLESTKDKLKKTMTEAPGPNESFTYYATVQTEGSYLSDESEISTMSNVDTQSTRFLNMMQIINNPDTGKGDDILNNLKGFVLGVGNSINTRLEQRRNRKLLRLTNKVARSISVETF